MHIARLEWRPADQQRVENDADRPDIDFKTVTFALVVEDFRSDVVGRTTNGLFALLWVLQQRRESKVADLHLHVFVEEHISQFKITVDDRVIMHVLNACKNLYHKVPRLRLQVWSTPFNDVIHVLLQMLASRPRSRQPLRPLDTYSVVTQLQHKVHIF